jgi:hypothetical protein
MFSEARHPMTRFFGSEKVRPQNEAKDVKSGTDEG